MPSSRYQPSPNECQYSDIHVRCDLIRGIINLEQLAVRLSLTRVHSLLTKRAREEVAELAAGDRKLGTRLTKLFECLPGDIPFYSLHSAPNIWLVPITFIGQFLPIDRRNIEERSRWIEFERVISA
jgi:hypothetical protein